MKLTVYSKNNCPFCVQAKNFLSKHDIPFDEVNIEHDDTARTMIVEQGLRTVPQIFLGDDLFVAGGWQGLSKLTPDDIRNRVNPEKLGTL